MLDNRSVRNGVARVVQPVARGLLAVGVTPDAVTIVGAVGLSATTLYFLPRGQFALGLIVSLCFAFSDLLDGTMARLSGSTGKWGAFLDSTLDRLADAAVFTGLLIYFVRTDSPWIVAACAACLIGGVLVSYSKARAEGLGVECTVGIAGRSERLIIAAIGVLLAALNVTYGLQVCLVILALLTIITVIQRMVDVHRSLRREAAAS
jgi:CDP-diacylglycerol--glycerol-3-phosphate 3-phosphatidyltransferase